MYSVATIEQLRARLGLEPGGSAEAERLALALEAATARIERASGRRHTPRLATVAHDVQDGRALSLAEDLLQLEGLVNGDGRAIGLDAVQTLPVGAEGVISGLRLRGAQRFVWRGSPAGAIQVRGIWGWHERWARAWRGGVDRAQDDPLAAEAVTLRVRDSGRFQRGQLLRLEREYARVTGIDGESHTLEVQRAAQGSVAAAHARDTRIDIYEPPRAVTMLCLRLALWLYREPDREGDGALPADIGGELAGLRRERVGA